MSLLPADLLADSADTWEKSFRVDMMHTVNAVAAAVPFLEKSKSPSIVLISSVSGFEVDFAAGSYGAIKAENWRAWNFRIEDHTGQEVARITKTFEGIAKTLFTTADNYVVQIHGQIPQPLNSLVVAAALSVDTALKQDSRGLG